MQAGNLLIADLVYFPVFTTLKQISALDNNAALPSSAPVKRLFSVES